MPARWRGLGMRMWAMTLRLQNDIEGRKLPHQLRHSTIQRERQSWRKSYGPCKPIFRARDGLESGFFCCSGDVACQTVICKSSLQTALVEIITAKGQPSISLKKFGAPGMPLYRHALILR